MKNPSKYKIIAGHIKITDGIDKFLAKLKEYESKYRVSIAALDAERICDSRHLESAAEHAARAFARKTNICETLGAEVLVYAACERQIHNAIKKLGVRPMTKKIALVIFGACPTARLVKELVIIRDDNVLGYKEKFDFPLFGITKTELELLPEEKRGELMLEQVAMMDIEK